MEINMNGEPQNKKAKWRIILLIILLIVIILLLLRSCSTDVGSQPEREPEKTEILNVVKDDCVPGDPSVEKEQKELIESEKIQPEDLSVGEDNKSSAQLNTKTTINPQQNYIEEKKDNVDKIVDDKTVSSDSNHHTNPSSPTKPTPPSKPNIPTEPEIPQQPEPPIVEATEGEVVLKVLGPNGDPVNSAAIELWTSDFAWSVSGDTNENGDLKKTIPFGVEINYLVYGELVKSTHWLEGTFTADNTMTEKIFQYEFLDKYEIKIKDRNGKLYDMYLDTVEVTTSEGESTIKQIGQSSSDRFYYSRESMNGKDTVSITGIEGFSLVEPVIIEKDKPCYVAIVEPIETYDVEFILIDNTEDGEVADDGLPVELNGIELDLEDGIIIQLAAGNHTIKCESYDIDLDSFIVDANTTKITITCSDRVMLYDIILHVTDYDGTPFVGDIMFDRVDGSFNIDDTCYEDNPGVCEISSIPEGEYKITAAGSYDNGDDFRVGETTVVVNCDGDYFVQFKKKEPIPVETIEKKIIILDQDGNRISDAEYELGGDGFDIAGTTDENGEAVIEIPSYGTLSSCYIMFDGDYLYNGSLTITEDTPYEITLPTDLENVTFF